MSLSGSIHPAGTDVLPDVRDLRGRPRDAAVRVQHGRDQRARGQHRELHEGRVQGPVRRGHQRGVHPAAVLGRGVDLRDRRHARWLQRRLDGEPVREVIM